MLLKSVLITAVAVVAACQPNPTASPTSNPTQGPTQIPPATPTPANTQAIDASTFTKFGGCGDVFMWATNADGTMAITVDWQGAATGAWDNGEFDETASLAEAPVVVSLVAGRGLDQLYCNDVLMPGMSEDNKIAAHEGSVRLVVTPDEGGFKPAGHSDATLSDLGFNVVVGADEETWQLDQMSIENVSVGWLAG